MKDYSRENSGNLIIRFVVVIGILAAFLWVSACKQQPSDEQLRQQAADATKQVKQGAKQAADDARVAAANAERKANAIAAGVKDGLKSNGKPAAGVVNINAASEEQLVDLPGITGSRAQRIIRGRPYSSPDDLVSKGILTREQYERISGQIAVD